MSSDDERPKLTVVAENSDRQIATEFARSDLDYRLRDLAANIIRVVHGAGKSHDLINQCISVIDAAREYHEAAGRLPSSVELDRMLRIRQPDPVGSDFSIDRHCAMEEMISGSLRLTAARLLDQKLQETHGEQQLTEGFHRLERLIATLLADRLLEKEVA